MGRHGGYKPTSRDHPVFASLNGRRGLAILALLAVAVVNVLLVLQLSQLLSTALPDAPQFNGGVNYPRQIANEMATCGAKYGEIQQDGNLGIPIVGSGVFQRVVEVIHANGTVYAIDPFSHSVVMPQLTPLEIHNTNVCRYALEQFGEVPPRTMILTIDDGPSKVWTPKILAVLAAYHVKATFFEIGVNILAAPDTFKEVIASGNEIGNHTLTHPLLVSLSPSAARQQIVATEHIMATLGDYETAVGRTPYGGGNLYGDDSVRSNVFATLVFQQLGLTEVGFTADSSDFDYPPYAYIPTPTIGGPGDPGQALVLHDAGGKNDEATYSLIIRVIQKAQAEGYHFMTMGQLLQMQGGNRPAVSHIHPTIADEVGYWRAWASDQLPQTVLPFVLKICTIVVLCFALFWMTRALWGGYRQYRPVPAWHPKLVTVGIAAFNEAKVIETTVRTLFAFDYGFDIQAVVINDGSTDETGAILDSLATEFSAYPRQLMAVHLARNMRKGLALFELFKNHAEGEVTVTLDADTIVSGPETIPYLVRHFRDPEVGAVAGYIQAGNKPSNPWKWILLAFQRSEYNLGIAVQRVAQGKHGILIVPGACSAWRTSLMRQIGMSNDTAGEDADAGLAVREAGYRVELDINARAITQCPCTIRAVARQWTRWTFGTIQNFYKHRTIMGHPAKYGGLTWVMWYSAISFLVPLVLLPVSYGVTVLAALNGNWSKVVLYYAVFTIFRLLQNLTAMVVLREWSWDPVTAVFYRFINDPLQIYLAWRTLFALATGRLIGWDGTRAKRVEMRKTEEVTATAQVT
jgi:cellulose synthase/poly-beta-1,6-N-acetylglucosamine synthase-like glycosyltransferase/peptidoglycan/xylan/chitin deacetylase (PgdA/CDA1 family)